MFAPRYFPERYFPARYFPSGGAGVTPGPIPTLASTGPYARLAGDVNLVIDYPASVPAGAVCYLQFGHLNSGGQAAAVYSVPSEWEQRYADQVANCRQWVFRHQADGTEGGTSVTITVTGGTSGGIHSGAIHVFTDAAPDQEEGAAATTGTTADVTDSDVATDGIGRLALQFGFHSASQDPAEFTGETGGDWQLASQSDQGWSARPWLQTADMGSGGTVGGGGFTKSGTGAWIVRGFAVVYEVYVPSTPVDTALPTGGGGGWHGDYDFRNRPREKATKVVQQHDEVQVTAEDDAEIVAILMISAGY